VNRPAWTGLIGPRPRRRFADASISGCPEAFCKDRRHGGHDGLPTRPYATAIEIEAMNGPVLTAPRVEGGAGGEPLLLPAAVDLIGLRRIPREQDLPSLDTAGEGHHQLFLGRRRTGQCGAKGQAEEKCSDLCAQSKIPDCGLPKPTLRKIVAAM
jgi:hypothetical protein